MGTAGEPFASLSGIAFFFVVICFAWVYKRSVVSVQRCNGRREDDRVYVGEAEKEGGLELGMPNRQLPSPAITTLMNLFVYKLMTDGGEIILATFLGSNGRRMPLSEAGNEEIGWQLRPPEFLTVSYWLNDLRL